MSAKARLSAVILTLAGLLGSAPAVTAATAAPAPAHHAVVADTWTGAAARDTWT